MSDECKACLQRLLWWSLTTGAFAACSYNFRLSLVLDVCPSQKPDCAAYNALLPDTFFNCFAVSDSARRVPHQLPCFFGWVSAVQLQLLQLFVSAGLHCWLGLVAAVGPQCNCYRYQLAARGPAVMRDPPGVGSSSCGRILRLCQGKKLRQAVGVRGKGMGKGACSRRLLAGGGANTQNDRCSQPLEHQSQPQEGVREI